VGIGSKNEAGYWIRGCWVFVQRFPKFVYVLVYFLPPYSSQLNPDEQVWKNVKEWVAKQLPRDKYGLRILIHKGLQRLQAMTDIVRGFFAHPECGFVK
jgi:transposase